MGLCQYFAYIEIIAEEEARFLKSDRNGTELWLAYRRRGPRMGPISR
jgi:uncharacterized protein